MFFIRIQIELRQILLPQESDFFFHPKFTSIVEYEKIKKNISVCSKNF